MVLSYTDIENIADATIDDFNKFMFPAGRDLEGIMPHGTPIDQLTSDYLKLKVTFEHLSSDGSFCGLTAYEDTSYSLEENGVVRVIPLKRNQVLLDSSFIEPGKVKKLCGKRRFTLAHECAHQILFQLENEDTKTSCRKKYSERKCYSLRDLKNREDWNEWQANALGAALLMPQKEISLAVWRFSSGKNLVSYNGYFNYMDHQAVKMMCDAFRVSRSALIIRLAQLWYLDKRPYSEYYDPLEILA